jgi:hypothetical protein
VYSLQGTLIELHVVCSIIYEEQFPFGSIQNSEKYVFKKSFLAEFLGTFTLVFISAGALVAREISSSPGGYSQ